MSILKDNLIPTLIILLAGLIVSFAAVPLQNTEWADGIRTGFSEDGEGSEREEADGERAVGEEGRPGGVIMIIGPLIKVTILMGIGGLLTALVLWIIGKVKGPRART